MISTINYAQLTSIDALIPRCLVFDPVPNIRSCVLHEM